MSAVVCTQCGALTPAGCVCYKPFLVVGEFEQLRNKVAALEAEVRELKARQAVYGPIPKTEKPTDMKEYAEFIAAAVKNGAV